MREIKFRGKRIDNGELVYGYFLYGAILDQHVIWTDHENWIVDPETVGQFTGLKDRDGNEVYEGDIVDLRDHPFEGPMKINGMYEVGYNERMELCCGSLLLHRELPYITVIGNVHDNPELLQTA